MASVAKRLILLRTYGAGEVYTFFTDSTSHPTRIAGAYSIASGFVRGKSGLCHRADKASTFCIRLKGFLSESENKDAVPLLR